MKLPNKKVYHKKAKPLTTENVCKWFGCGKRLKDYEALASDYCFTHAQIISQQRKRIF